MTVPTIKFIPLAKDRRLINIGTRLRSRRAEQNPLELARNKVSTIFKNVPADIQSMCTWEQVENDKITFSFFLDVMICAFKTIQLTQEAVQFKRVLTGEVVEHPQALSAQSRVRLKISLTKDTQGAKETCVLRHYITPSTDQQVTKATEERPNELQSKSQSQKIKKRTRCDLSERNFLRWQYLYFFFYFNSKIVCDVGTGCCFAIAYQFHPIIKVSFSNSAP